MEIRFDNFLISDDKQLLDLTVIKSFLARSYWAARRTEEAIEKSVANSVCYGVYDNGGQIGYARVVTDDATVFYLCDVFIDEQYRGRGIGKRLVAEITESDRFRRLTGLLGTMDAHQLYEQVQFVKDPERFMRRPPLPDRVIKSSNDSG